MGKGLLRSLGRAPVAQQHHLRFRIPLVNVSIPMTGASGEGWGSALVGTIPLGNYKTLTSGCEIQFAGPGSGDLVDDWEGQFGVGTEPLDSGTLNIYKINLIEDVNIPAATAELSPVVTQRGTGSASIAFVPVIANTGNVYLNLTIDDIDISSDAIIMTANGFLDFIIVPVFGDI